MPFVAAIAKACTCQLPSFTNMTGGPPCPSCLAAQVPWRTLTLQAMEETVSVRRRFVELTTENLEVG